MGQTGEGILLPRPGGRTRGRGRSGRRIGWRGGTGTVPLLRGPATGQRVGSVTTAAFVGKATRVSPT